LLARARKTGPPFAQGDFDADGVVGFSDLLILAQNYDQPVAAIRAALKHSRIRRR